MKTSANTTKLTIKIGVEISACGGQIPANVEMLKSKISAEHPTAAFRNLIQNNVLVTEMVIPDQHSALSVRSRTYQNNVTQNVTMTMRTASSLVVKHTTHVLINVFPLKKYVTV